MDVQYSVAALKKVKGNAKVGLQYCNAVKINVDNETDNIDINSSYSTLYLDLAKNLSAEYDVNTKLGTFDNKSNFAITGGQGTGPNKNYTGKSGNGGSKVKVSSSFGKVFTGHDLDGEFTSKKNASRNRKIN